MATTNDQYTAVRIEKQVLERAAKLGDEIGGVSAAWVCQRCVLEMLELVEANPRIVPKLAKMIDGIRGADVPLIDQGREGGKRARGGGR